MRLPFLVANTDRCALHRSLVLFLFNYGWLRVKCSYMPVSMINNLDLLDINEVMNDWIHG